MTTYTTNSYSATNSDTPQVPLLRRIGLYLAARKQRARLAELDDHLLRDIGISRDQARRESSRKAWDVPQHWLK